MHYISYVLSDTNAKEAVGSQLKIISPETREWDRLLWGYLRTVHITYQIDALERSTLLHRLSRRSKVTRGPNKFRLN